MRKDQQVLLAWVLFILCPGSDLISVDDLMPDDEGNIKLFSASFFFWQNFFLIFIWHTHPGVNQKPTLWISSLGL